MKKSAGERLVSLLDCRCDIPKEHSLSTYHLAFIWNRLKAQGLDSFLFAMGTVQSFDVFKETALDNSIWTYAGFSKTDGEPCAFAMLDNIQGRTARLHYTFFRNDESLKNKDEYARTFCEFLFDACGLDCIILFTPCIFRHSNRLARRLGAEFMGDIPSSIPVYFPEKLEYRLCDSNLYKLVSPHYKKGVRQK